MPSSVRSLIIALKYVRAHEPIGDIGDNISPPFEIFYKLYKEQYLSGSDASACGSQSLMEVTITCKGLEYLQHLEENTAPKIIIGIVTRIAWIVLGALLIEILRRIIT
ncbi:MAG: hypothetical protein ABIB93_00440 [Chloroflexota bacterium]